MKITNSDLIKNREKELLEIISDDLDRDGIKKLLAAKYNIDLDTDSLTCQGGDLVVHDNQVVYQLNFEAVVGLSLLFNRQGECLEVDSTLESSPTGERTDISESVAGAPVSADDGMDKVDSPDENGGQESDSGGDSPSARMASNIADMISEINKD